MRFHDKPVFVLTSDTDWASEDAISFFLDDMARMGLRPHLFLTHPSAVVSAARACGAIDVGIHPNFLPGSTHGTGFVEPIAHCLSLVPGSVSSRCHTFFECSPVLEQLWAQGIRYDSNACHFLQPSIEPTCHAYRLMRLPVFWEDDVHAGYVRDLTFDLVLQRLATPGLKILNVHPFSYAINMPDLAFYQQMRPQTRTLTAQDIAEQAWQGQGTRSWLRAIVAEVARLGGEFITLAELHSFVAASPWWAERRFLPDA